jgi:hypothetical protein
LDEEIEGKVEDGRRLDFSALRVSDRAVNIEDSKLDCVYVGGRTGVRMH